jgi:hypothetical protein
MDTERKPTNATRRLFRRTLGILAGFIVVSCVFVGRTVVVGFQKAAVVAQRADLQNEMVRIQADILSYYTEYGVYPVASDNATLVRILTGSDQAANKSKIQFLEVEFVHLDDANEVIDPWGTPLQLSVTADGKFSMRSAGPDKIFGTADDISNQ